VIAEEKVGLSAQASLTRATKAKKEDIKKSVGKREILCGVVRVARGPGQYVKIGQTHDLKVEEALVMRGGDVKRGQIGNYWGKKSETSIDRMLMIAHSRRRGCFDCKGAAAAQGEKRSAQVKNWGAGLEIRHLKLRKKN